ncbi:MAG: PorT family protein [Candidatus Aminicenantes bacterium]|nr:PorT family protein [Candidatus Aminicenantes bacterium]
MARAKRGRLKKYVLAFFLGIPLVAAASAQEVKLLGGAGLSSYSICPRGVRNWYSPYLEFQTAYRPGFLVGAGLECSLAKRVGLEIDILYFQKGSKLSATRLLDEPAWESEYTLNVISLPILVKLKALPGSSPYLVHGGELSYVIAHRSASTYYPDPYIYPAEPNALSEDIKEKTRRVGLGAVVGAGWEIRYRGVALSIELRYHFGLLNLLSEEGSGPLSIASMKSNSQVILCGLRF